MGMPESAFTWFQVELPNFGFVVSENNFYTDAGYGNVRFFG